MKPILSRFCNIYIPFPSDNNNKIINLHFHKKNIYKTHLFYTKRDTWLFNELQKSKNFKNIPCCIKTSEKLYKNGYSALDVLKYIKEFHENDKKFLYLVYFDKIRK